MANYHIQHLNWDEFRWEQEIRRDERRINCYFRTLPACLDLPGEDEMVSGTIAACPDLVSGVVNMSSAWSYQASENCEEEENTSDRDYRRPGENLIESLDKLATEWNLYCSTDEGPQFAALSISCAYAKLLARAADFFDTPATQNALKRCLGKRTLNDLLELNLLLEMLAETSPACREFSDFQRSRLIGLREQFSNHLVKCQ